MHQFQRDMAEVDSASDKLFHHGYHRVYPWFLAHLRQRAVSILEIGIHEAESLRLWRQYFPNGLTLHGIDRDPKPTPEGPVVIHQVDQGSVAELRQFRETAGISFDVILDDGSHVPSHQLLTLKELWPLLVPGGIYIIEDIETSYWGRSWVYGYAFDANRKRDNAIALIPSIVEAINSEYLTGSRRAQVSRHPLAAVINDIELVTAGPNCIVLVKKDRVAFGKFYDRPYRYQDKIGARRRTRELQRRIARAARTLREKGIVGLLRRLITRHT